MSAVGERPIRTTISDRPHEDSPELLELRVARCRPLRPSVAQVVDLPVASRGRPAASGDRRRPAAGTADVARVFRPSANLAAATARRVRRERRGDQQLGATGHDRRSGRPPWPGRSSANAGEPSGGRRGGRRRPGRARCRGRGVGPRPAMRPSASLVARSPRARASERAPWVSVTRRASRLRPSRPPPPAAPATPPVRQGGSRTPRARPAEPAGADAGRLASVPEPSQMDVEHLAVPGIAPVDLDHSARPPGSRPRTSATPRARAAPAGGRSHPPPGRPLRGHLVQGQPTGRRPEEQMYEGGGAQSDRLNPATTPREWRRRGRRRKTHRPERSTARGTGGDGYMRRRDHHDRAGDGQAHGEVTAGGLERAEVKALRLSDQSDLAGAPASIAEPEARAPASSSSAEQSLSPPLAINAPRSGRAPSRSAGRTRSPRTSRTGRAGP